MAKNGNGIYRFGEFLKRKRARKKLNQQDFARYAGLSPACINLLESGTRRGMRTDTAVKLAKATETSIDQILRLAAK